MYGIWGDSVFGSTSRLQSVWICFPTDFFFLGVHPWDKRAVQNCFHSITLSASLQHRRASKVALCCMRNRAAVFALSLNNADSSIRWRLETRHWQSCGGEPRSLWDCYLSRPVVAFNLLWVVTERWPTPLTAEEQPVNSTTYVFFMLNA